MDIIKPLSKFPGNMREGHAKWFHENTIIRIRIRSSTGNQDEKNINGRDNVYKFEKIISKEVCRPFEYANEENGDEFR